MPTHKLTGEIHVTNHCGAAVPCQPALTGAIKGQMYQKMHLLMLLL